MKDRVRNEAVGAAPKKVPLTIARLGAAAGVGVETVRYYQRRGRLPGTRGA
ncbi:MAG: MerR family regulatory protein [Sphingomonadales bacterium]|jgi:hypothetical protein|nr:MerR family regulatory protein [Sphingomonadales bacterium]